MMLSNHGVDSDAGARHAGRSAARQYPRTKRERAMRITLLAVILPFGVMPSEPESFSAADAGTMPTDICGNLVDAWMKRASDACDRRWRVTQGPVLGLRVISRLLMQSLRSLRTHPSPNP